MTKKYDVVIKVGEYTNASGETKSRYKNIGVINEGTHGAYLLLDATILSMPLFALVNKERKDMVLCSLFEPKDSGAAPNNSEPKNTAEEINDDIPF